MYKDIISNVSRNTGIPQYQVDEIIKAYSNFFIRQVHTNPEFNYSFLGMVLIYQDYMKGLVHLRTEHSLNTQFLKETPWVSEEELVTVMSAFKSYIIRELAKGEIVTIHCIGKFKIVDGHVRFWLSTATHFDGSFARILQLYRNEVNDYLRSLVCKELPTALAG